MKPVGWRGESARHAKAARGIKTKPGVVKYPVLYHGTTKRGLRVLDPAASQRTSFGALPAVSATNHPLLAETFTRGELGDKPRGEILELEGPFTIVDTETSAGRKMWVERLDRNPVALLEEGYDGIQFKNLEELKVEAFYKDIPWDEIKNAKEVQLFRKVEPKYSETFIN